VVVCQLSFQTLCTTDKQNVGKLPKQGKTFEKRQQLYRDNP
jgi:hypothetical protein